MSTHSLPKSKTLQESIRAGTINETAVKLMGFRNPLGQIINNPFENINWHVVGVVQDYIEGSPYEKIPPTVILGEG